MPSSRVPTSRAPTPPAAQPPIPARRPLLALALLPALLPTLVPAWLGFAPRAAQAHGPGHGTGAATGPVRKVQKPWGMAGEAAAVRRSIDIRMGDDMRFRPSHLEVALGETLRFVVHNEGALMHEFVIGTQAELDEHARLMEKHPGMEHDEPWMAHVEPGRSGSLVWRFNRAGDFHFACLVAGHYRAGMRGTLRVKAARATG